MAGWSLFRRKDRRILSSRSWDDVYLGCAVISYSTCASDVMRLLFIERLHGCILASILFV